MYLALFCGVFYGVRPRKVWRSNLAEFNPASIPARKHESREELSSCGLDMVPTIGYTGSRLPT